MIIASCKKKDEYPNHDPCNGHYNDTVNLTTDFLNYRYKTGSYWVMTDSISGNIDSLGVISYNQGYSGPCVYFQYHDFKTITYPSLDTDLYEIKVYSITKDNTTRVFTSDAYECQCSYTHYDSLFISNQYYRNVTMTMVFPDATQGNNKGIYYMSPDFGFVKIDVVNDSTGALISRKILQRENIIR